jgi:alkanesulfonate monooxygenase SsuD/methylene tetrahydromethanopterin reductase-like flavin-dependent oxidoreductase (luciferase family)
MYLHRPERDDGNRMRDEFTSAPGDQYVADLTADAKVHPKFEMGMHVIVHDTDADAMFLFNGRVLPFSDLPCSAVAKWDELMEQHLYRIEVFGTDPIEIVYIPQQCLEQRVWHPTELRQYMAVVVTEHPKPP